MPNPNKDRPIEDFERIRNQTQPGDESQVDLEKLPDKNRGPVREVWDKVQTLVKTLQDPNAGLSAKAIAMAALLYLISPVDAIPDAIPVLGLTDDVSVIVYAVIELSKLSSMTQIMKEGLYLESQAGKNKGT